MNPRDDLGRGVVEFLASIIGNFEFFKEVSQDGKTAQLMGSKEFTVYL